MERSGYDARERPAAGRTRPRYASRRVDAVAALLEARETTRVRGRSHDHESPRRDKACKKVDVKVAQAASGMFRPLTSSNVESHLKNVGLDAEFATHHRISALSGGQKVKVVLGAAMWMQPHLVILDEPTNYLDRESLGALADAIREFEGGVVIISHNNDFTTALCPETWVVEKDEDEVRSRRPVV